jgi:hypothetical protein
LNNLVNAVNKVFASVCAFSSSHGDLSAIGHKKCLLFADLLLAREKRIKNEIQND